MSSNVTIAEVQEAIREGILEKIKALAIMEATNEASEDPAEAETQFGRGLRLALDALDRGFAEVEKIYPD